MAIFWIWHDHLIHELTLASVTTQELCQTLSTRSVKILPCSTDWSQWVTKNKNENENEKEKEKERTQRGKRNKLRVPEGRRREIEGEYDQDSVYMWEIVMNKF